MLYECIRDCQYHNRLYKKSVVMEVKEKPVGDDKLRIERYFRPVKADEVFGEVIVDKKVEKKKVEDGKSSGNKAF